MFNVNLLGNGQTPHHFNPQNDEMDVDTIEEQTENPTQIPPSPLSTLESFLKGAPGSIASLKEISGIDLFASGTLAECRIDNVSFNLLTHIFGDSIINESSLEGGSLKTHLKFVIQVLQHAPLDTTNLIQRLQTVIDIQNAIDRMTDLEDVNQLVGKIIDKLDHLKNGEEFLCPGGWIRGEGGHQILYQVTQQQNIFKLCLINTGLGTSYHQTKIHDGIEYVDPYFVISNIKKERMLSPSFWRFAITLQAPPNKKATKYSYFDERSVYEQLIPILGSTSMGYAPKTNVKPQNSGTCSWKVIVAYLKSQIDQREWHHVNLMIKFLALGNWIWQHREISSYAESLILEKAAHGLANEAKKYYNLISREPYPENEKQIRFLLEVCSLSENVKALVKSKGIEPFFRKSETKQTSQSTCHSFESLAQSCSATHSLPGLKNKLDLVASGPAEEPDDKKTSNTLKLVAIESIILTPPSYDSQGKQLLPFLEEWKQFLEKACRDEEHKLAVWHFEQMLQNQPLEVPEVVWTDDVEQKFLRKLSELAKLYYIKSNGGSLTAGLTAGWHLFLWMSQVATKRISSKLNPSVQFDQWGIYVPWFDSFTKEKVLDLSKHHRLREFQEFIQRCNEGKTYFLFDTIEIGYKIEYNHPNVDFRDSDADRYGDFVLIKRCLKHTSKKSAGSNKFFKSIRDQFKSRPKKGAVLPKEYYQLREVYFLALDPESEETLPTNQDFHIVFPLVVDKKVYTLMPSLQPITAAGNKSVMSSDKKNGEKKKKEPSIRFYHTRAKIWERGLASPIQIARSGLSQNAIRSKSQGIFELIFAEIWGQNLESITKNELYRMVDIGSAQEGKFALCVNYFLENPLSFFKPGHLALFQSVFYQFCLVQDSLRDMPFLRRNFPILMKNIIPFFFKGYGDMNGFKLVCEIVIDYLELEPDKHHFSFLIQFLMIQRSLENAGIETVRTIEELLLQAYSISWLALSKEDFSQILSISGTTGSHQWKRSTFPLFVKLEQFLRDERTASEILDQVETISSCVKNRKQNSAEKFWKKDNCHFLKNGWTFDLYTNTLYHKDFGSVDTLLNTAVPTYGYNNSANRNTVFKDLLDDPRDFVISETPGEFINSNQTVRILQKQGKVLLYEKLDGTWCEFQFLETLSDLIHVKEVFLGDSAAFRTELQWFSKEIGDEEAYLGKLKGESIQQFELIRVGEEWKIVDRKKGLICGGAVKPKELPYPLNQCLYTKEDQSDIACWINASDGTIREIIIRSPYLSFVTKGDGRYTVQGYHGDTLFNGYTLSDRVIPSPFLSIGPFFPLEDTHGKPFVLIPHPVLFNISYFKTVGETNDPLCPEHTFSDIIPQQWQYRIYRVDEKTHDLIPEDLQAQIFLSYLYLIDQNWEKCFSLLEKCKQTYPYSKSEREQFLVCFSHFALGTGKSHWLKKVLPQQCAFLLKIFYSLIMTRSLQYSSDDWLILMIKHIVNKYVQFYQTIPVEYRLTVEEEQSLIHLTKNYLVKDFLGRERKMQFDMSRLNQKFGNSLVPQFDTPISLFQMDSQRMKSEVDCGISKEAAKDLDYQAILKDFSPFTLSSVKEIGSDEPLSEKIALALWMGILSDNDQEFTETASKICFCSKGKLKNGISAAAHYKRLEFLRLALRYSEPYKSYLLLNHSDHRNPESVLDNWPKFVESKGGELPDIRAFNHSTHDSKKLGKNSITLPQLPNINASKEERSFLTSYLWIENHSDLLIGERNKLLKTFFAMSETEEPASFEPLHLTDEAESLLDELPLAKRLYTDLIKPRTVSSRSYQIRSIDSLKDVLAAIKEMLNKRKTLSLELGRQIEKEVNITPLDQGETVTVLEVKEALSTKLNQLSHHQRRLTTKDVAINLLVKRWKGLKQANPYLSESDLEVLFYKTIDWMLLEIEVSLLDKVEKEITDICKNVSSKTIKEVNAALVQATVLLSSKRYFKPMKKPHLLAFEYLAEVILRKSQIEKINELIAFKGSHTIVQLMMGDGKTTLMLPYFAKMLANGKRLPIIVAPRSLFQEYLKIMKALSQNELMQKIHVLKFDRSSSTKPEHLSQLLADLQNAEKARDLFICTPETAKALLLKYEELLVLEEEALRAGAQDTTDLTARRKILQDIHLFLGKHGCALIDESHLALKSLQEMNFTLAKSENPKRWEVETILDLYKLLDQMGYDFTKPLTSNFVTDTDDFVQWRAGLIEALLGIENDGELRSYLQGKNEAYYSKLNQSNPDFAKKLALIQQEIWVYLSFTLSRELNRHYGRHPTDPEVHVAIPFVGARTPNPRSLFSHKYVMLNYTIQMTLLSGLNETQFIAWFKKQRRLWEEIAGSGSPQEADRFFEPFFGTNSIRNLRIENKQQMDELYRYFSKHKDVIFDYLQTILLPSIEIHTDKLNATEQELGNLLFNQVLLFSGTPYNAPSYPRPFQKLEAPNEDIDFEDALFQDEEEQVVSATQEAESRLIAALCRPQNRRIELAEEASSQSALLAIVEHDAKAQHQNLSAFIDSGAFCKDIPAKEAASYILEKLPRVDGVLFFEDNSDKLLVLGKDKKVKPYLSGSIPLEKVFAYLDHMHSFGADLVLPPTAEALVTVNQTCLFEFKQGIKRMRQIEQLQTVTYLVPEILATQCEFLTHSGELSVESLSLQTIFNEAKQVEREIILATLHELKLLVKKKTLKKQLDSKDNLKLAKAALVENIDSTPSGQLMGKISPTDLFTHYIKRILKSMPFVKVDWKQEVDPIIERAASLLPDLIDGYAMEALDQMQEVEKQQEQVKKVEILNEEIKEFEPDVETPVNLRELLINGPKIIDDPLSSWYSEDGGLTCYRLNDFVALLNQNEQHLFDNAILITRNFAKMAAVEHPSWNRPIKPVDYVLHLTHAEGQQCFLIITLQEMAHIFRALRLDQEGSMTTQSLIGLPWKATLYNLMGQPFFKDLSSTDPAFKWAFVQISTFDEKHLLSQEDERILLAWSQGKEDSILKLLENLHTSREKEGSFKYGAIAKTLLTAQAAQRSVRFSNIIQPAFPQAPGSLKRPASQMSVSSSDPEEMDVDTADEKPKHQEKKLKLSHQS